MVAIAESHTQATSEVVGAMGVLATEQAQHKVIHASRKTYLKSRATRLELRHLVAALLVNQSIEYRANLQADPRPVGTTATLAVRAWCARYAAAEKRLATFTTRKKEAQQQKEVTKACERVISRALEMSVREFTKLDEEVASVTKSLIIFRLPQ